MSDTFNARDWLRTGMVGIFMLAITAMFLGMIRGFLETLFLAAVFSAMAMPLYRWLCARFNGRKAAASACTLVVLIAAVLLPGLFLITLMAGQAADLATNVVPWAKKLVADISQLQPTLPDWVPFREKIEALGPQIAAKMTSVAGEIGQFLLGSVAAATQGTAKFLLKLFVLLYAMFFFLIDGPSIVEKVLKITTLGIEMQRKIMTQGYIVARATIKGTLVIGAVQGFLGGIGLWATGVPNAVLWGAVMAIASVLPGIGTALVWLPAVVYLLAMGQTLPAIGLAVWSAALVGTIDNILRPKLVGGDTKMPDLVVLVSTFGGLATFGASGLVIGPVVAAVFFTTWDVFAEANQPADDAGAERTGPADPGG